MSRYCRKRKVCNSRTPKTLFKGFWEGSGRKGNRRRREYWPRPKATPRMQTDPWYGARSPSGDHLTQASPNPIFRNPVPGDRCQVMVVNKGQAGAVINDFKPRNRMNRMGCVPFPRADATPARIAPDAR